MYTLYLIRHGESTQNTGVNQKDRIPDHAIPLTEKGHKQASDVGEFLDELLKGVYPDRIALWRSPYLRTRQTSEEILKHMNIRSVKEDSMLAELQFGIFDAIPKQDLPKIFPKEWEEYQRVRQFNGKYYARRPGGESPFDCEIRQKLWLDSLYRDFGSSVCPHHILVVGHGAALTILRKAIFHYSHEWYAEEPNPGNCSIQVVTLDRGDNLDRGYIYGNAED